jgi:hypothetical protein
MRLSLLVIGVVALGAILIACWGVCTAVSCQDGFSAKVHRTDGSFPSGTHQIDVVADGVSLSCTFTFPLPTVAGGGTSEPSCPPGMTVSVLPATDCTETNSGSTSAETCTDIPGQFVEWITLTARPGSPSLSASGVAQTYADGNSSGTTSVGVVVRHPLWAEDFIGDYLSRTVHPPIGR